MAFAGAVEKGNACLEQRENIPGAPLWHMGKVAVLESKASFDLLQNTIDYLTCKGKLGNRFTDQEKEFMKELYEALWWGGKYKGFSEAAQLANHYVNGNGRAVTLDFEVYKSSAIVTDAMTVMKGFIRERSTNKLPVALIRSTDPDFLRSTHAASLKQAKRSVVQQGYILNDGALLVEQSNLRLKNTDHRFHLQVSTTKGHNIFMSRWLVESSYDFEPFSKNFVTEVPLAKDFVLKLPDGLSQYLTTIGVAKAFKYSSFWNETWR